MGWRGDYLIVNYIIKLKFYIMKTSNQITKHLKEGKVTQEMLGMATFSYNKRAKNMRDNEREWRDFYRENRYYEDTYGKVDSYQEKKEEYYRRKDECLSLVEPTALHIVEREKTKREWDDACNDYVNVSDYVTEYYLLYEIGTYRFHHPITAEEFHKWENTLPVEEIGDLETEGEDVDNLMSVQTADKIRKGLKSGTYKLVA